MSLALHSAYLFVLDKLHAHAHTHLSVRIHDHNLIIYSVEQQEVTYRAILTCYPGNEFILSVTNHRGNWQMIPHVGSLPELMSMLTGNLSFTLTRWH